MAMIVAHHFACHGDFSFFSTDISFNRFWLLLIQMGGKEGVDLFVLISGYFLITEKEKIFNLRHVLKLWGQIIFYSFSIHLVFLLCGKTELGLKAAVKMLMPVTFSGWWFASTYFALYLIHPFLNRLLNGMDKATFQKYLVLLVIIWSVIPTFTTSAFNGSSLTWFVTLYSVAAYVRLYGLNPKLTQKHYFLLWLLFSALTYLSSVVFILLGTKWAYFSEKSLYFFGQDKLPMLLTALSLFMTFEKMELPTSKWINTISSATFGVYLIHDSNLVRPFLWKEVFHNASYQNSPYLLLYSLFAVATVFCVCALLDLLRKRCIEKPFMRLVNARADRWLLPFQRLTDWLKKLVFGAETTE